MRCAVLSLCVLFGAVVTVRADDPPTKDEALEKSVDRALAFLQSTQLADGSWGAGSQLQRFDMHKPAVTSLCVMAFLSAGNVPGEGRYGETVEKGIRWVLQHQQDNGLFAGNGAQEMYHHGICTLMLAEAAGMTDSKLGAEIRKRLVKAVDVILKAQRDGEGEDRGGWRYRMAHIEGSDISVTGWQIMALRAAKNIGCDVPADRIDRAVDFIKRCQDSQTGGFRYQPHANLTIPCTGTSILALELCGKDLHRGPEVLKAGALLLSIPPYWDASNGPQWGDKASEQRKWNTSFGFYGLYYCSQATFQLGGNYWDFFRPILRDMLFKNQKDNGSWVGENQDGKGGGPTYSTAMCVLALTVEYRYLPIYQRGEEPTDKK